MYEKFVKRPIDLILALCTLIITSPVFIIISIILHYANDGAGVFFTQLRPGYKGKVFKVIKFKTMNEHKTSDGTLLPDVQRITKLGGLIRKLSLDEYPQLFNVLKGDMSIVGPRPLLVQYLPLYSKEQFRRHDVRQGITGWAQCNGRNNLTWKKKFELDVWYVDNVSFKLDCKIVIKTIMKVLKSKDIENDTVENKKYTTPLFDGTN